MQHVQVGEGGHVGVDADAAGVDVRDQGEAHRRARRGCEAVEAQHLGPGQPAPIGRAGHVRGHEVDALQHRAEQRGRHLVGQVAEHAGQRVGDADGRLIPPAPGDGPERLHARRRVVDGQRHGEAGGCEPVAAGLVTFTPEVDRHGDAKLLGGLAVVLVVEAQATDQAGEEGVVHGPAHRLTGLGQVGEGEVERLEVAVEAPGGRHRAELLGGRSQELRRRSREPRSHREGGGGVGRGLPQQRAGLLQRVGAASFAAGLRHRGEIRLHRGVRFGVGEDRQQPDTANTVGHRVVQLQHDGRSAALDAVHHGEVPQRAGRVEGFAGLLAGQLEQLARRPRLRQPDMREVMLDVEARHVDPARHSGSRRAPRAGGGAGRRRRLAPGAGGGDRGQASRRAGRRPRWSSATPGRARSSRAPPRSWRAGWR